MKTIAVLLLFKEGISILDLALFNQRGAKGHSKFLGVLKPSMIINF